MMKWLNALLKTRGPVDLIRFIQMFDHGRGDYTKERNQWLSNDLDEIYTEIHKMRELVETIPGSG
ncbi:MAG: hypothetical protein NTV68_01730 [Methanomicrobiales archaeon]|nr:hypothetical protein [Methanomicrobiales archaeon]